MSKPREIWWSYVKGMIRQYPQLREEYRALHQPSMAMDYSGMPGTAAASRTVENIALRALPGNKQREYEAVRKAIAATERYPNGQDRLKLIQLYYWNGRRTLADAALTIPCAEATAKRWNADFIYLVWEKHENMIPQRQESRV